MCNLHTCLLCSVQPGYRQTYACDMARFALAFPTGSHVGYSAKLLASQVMRLPSIQGLVLNFPTYQNTTIWATLASLLAPDEDRLET